MNKIITVVIFPSAILYLFILSISFTSCYKQTECNGQVTVVDSINQAIEGATVHIYAGQVSQTGTTNINGIANFTLKLPAILTIAVSGVISNTQGKEDSVHGTGVIQFQTNETGYTTVVAK